MAVGVAGCAFGCVAALWCCLGDRVDAPPWSGRIDGLAYAGFRPGQSPLNDRYPTPRQIAGDIEHLSHYTTRLRTYETRTLSVVATEAARRKMTVLGGAWLSGKHAVDVREVDSLIELARAFPAIRGLLIGNETLSTHSVSQQELIQTIDRVRRATHAPVSTAQTWTIWLSHPELAQHVDFIAVHLLPYWDKVGVENAVDFTFDCLQQLRRAFPGRRIVVTEVGWPSAGLSMGAAIPSRENQSRFLRQFVNRAKHDRVEFYVIEAYDQVWKGAWEGRVGRYWGIFDTQHRLKISTGETRSGAVAFRQWGWSALAWMAIPVTLFCWRWSVVPVIGRWMFSVVLFAASGYVAWYVQGYEVSYEGSSIFLHWGLLPVNLLSLVLLVLLVWEVVHMSARTRFSRVFGVALCSSQQSLPMVSLHLACANEPPDIVITALKSLAQLEYSRYEVLVIDNNTSNEALWRPVEAWVQQHAPLFRFWHLPHCPGFKAEALNFALRQTSADARIIGVIDADYVVEPNWLHDLVGHFHDPAVGLVQSPQAYRDGEHAGLRRWISHEFDTFFRVGMHLRNEWNAIIQHGTMTLVRARVLRQLGGWAEWTIAEDAELGLRIAEAGYESRYVDRIYGRGLAPSNFAAYRAQRRRWALGAIQILWRHRGPLLGPSRLALGQRFCYCTGWLPWVGDSVHLVISILAAFWGYAAWLAPRSVDFPLPGTTILIFLAPVVRFAINYGLVRVRVIRCSSDAIGAVIAGMAVSCGAAEGVLCALWQRRATFIVTTKGGTPVRTKRLRSVRLEVFLIALLSTSGIALAFSRSPLPDLAWVWLATLLIQAMPYVASVICACVIDDAARLRPESRRPPARRTGAVRARAAWVRCPRHPPRGSRRAAPPDSNGSA